MATASRVAAIAAVVALAGAPLPVRAAPQRAVKIGVQRLAVDGDLPADVRTQLEQRLHDGLAGNARDIVRLDDEASCTTHECWQALAKRSGADHFVHARVLVRDRDYEITADLVDGRTGEVSGTASTTCEICGYAELGDSMDTVTSALQRKLSTSPIEAPMLVVRTTPPGATVFVDGEAYGTTPVRAAVGDGPHEIVVRKAGHVSQRRRVVSVAGMRETMTFQLAAAPASEAGKRAPALAIAGWSAFAVGLAGVGAGIGLLVVDNRPIKRDCGGDNVDVEGNCKYLHDTKAGGIAATVVGAALLATGIALVVVDRRRAKRTATTLSATPRGLVLSGRF